jgi:hypothetical protein
MIDHDRSDGHRRVRTPNVRRSSSLLHLVLALGLALPVAVVAAVVDPSPATVAAADISVCPSGCAHDSIGGAIEAAAAGDTILVADATYEERVTIDKDLTIDDASRAGTIVDGGALGTVVTIAAGTDVVIRDLTIRNGRLAAGDGAGINVAAAALDLDNVTLTGNDASNDVASNGGAIFNNGGTITVTGSVLSGNRARAGGSAVYSSGPAASVTIADTVVIDNIVTELTTDFRGGALHSVFGDLTVTNSQIVDNTGMAGDTVLRRRWQGRSPLLSRSSAHHHERATNIAAANRQQRNKGGPAWRRLFRTTHSYSVRSSGSAPDCCPKPASSSGASISDDHMSFPSPPTSAPTRRCSSVASRPSMRS